MGRLQQVWCVFLCQVPHLPSMDHSKPLQLMVGKNGKMCQGIPEKPLNTNSDDSDICTIYIPYTVSVQGYKLRSQHPSHLILASKSGCQLQDSHLSFLLAK